MHNNSILRRAITFVERFAPCVLLYDEIMMFSKYVIEKVHAYISTFYIAKISLSPQNTVDDANRLQWLNI